jgi:putative Mg2+ transporter-C (MgtC) family protein
MHYTDFIARIAIAFALGAVIGAERQWRQHRAGLRTNTLVAVGAALFVTLSFTLGEAGLPGDATRMAAQVVSGIGFLGAGVMMREGLTLRGLNTAATLWCSAAVGVLAGAGLGWHAVAGAGFVLAANLLLRPVARRFPDPGRADDSAETEQLYRLEAVCREEDEAHLRALILQTVAKTPLRLRRLQSADAQVPGTVEVSAELAGAGRADAPLEDIIARLSLERGVTAVSWELLASDWALPGGES